MSRVALLLGVALLSGCTAEYPADIIEAEPPQRSAQAATGTEPDLLVLGTEGGKTMRDGKQYLNLTLRIHNSLAQTVENRFTLRNGSHEATPATWSTGAPDATGPGQTHQFVLRLRLGFTPAEVVWNRTGTPQDPHAWIPAY